MPKIKNKNYLKFINDGYIDIIDQDVMGQVIKSLSDDPKKEEITALIICSYVTGARPNEVLRIRAKDIRYVPPTSVYIKLEPSKHGLAREIKVSTNNVPMVRALYDYSRKMFSDMYLFYHFKNSYKRTVITKTGQVKEYECNSDLLRYWFKKWFAPVMRNPINPYFLRHNRFSSMVSRGATIEEVRLWKGAKTAESVTPYLHMSKRVVDKAAKSVF